MTTAKNDQKDTKDTKSDINKSKQATSNSSKGFASMDKDKHHEAAKKGGEHSSGNKSSAKSTTK